MHCNGNVFILSLTIKTLCLVYTSKKNRKIEKIPSVNNFISICSSILHQDHHEQSYQNMSFFHCDTYENQMERCPDSIISFKSYHRVLQNESLSDAIHNTSRAVQLSPQAVHAVLRISEYP